MNPEPSLKEDALIGLGLLFAIAAGILLVNGHGLAGALSALSCIGLGLRAFRSPV